MRAWLYGRFVCVYLMLPLVVACRKSPAESHLKVTESGPAGMSRDQVVALAKSAHLKDLDLDNSNMNEVVTILQRALDRAAENGARPQIRLAEAWSTPNNVRRSPEEVRVTLSLRDIPLEEALEYVGEITSTGFRYEDGFISLTPSLSAWGERKRCACGAFLGEDPEHAEGHE